MKRTLLVLASFMTMVLLSCSDNSNPLAEELNSQQPTALEKVNTGASPEATGSSKLTSGVAWGVAGVPVGASAWSNALYFNFTAPPANATNTSYTFCPGAVSENKGAFTIDYLEIECGNYYIDLPWNGSGCVSTTVFVGDPARTSCYVWFHGKCVGGYYPVLGGPYVAQCNKSYSGGNLTNYYQY
jgi:hypothetical protein